MKMFGRPLCEFMWWPWLVQDSTSPYLNCREEYSTSREKEKLSDGQRIFSTGTFCFLTFLARNSLTEIYWEVPDKQKIREKINSTFLIMVLGCYSEAGFHIGMDRNFVCLWRRHNCHWSLPFCADLLIFEINYWAFKQFYSNLHAIISTLLIINLHWVKNFCCIRINL